MVKLLIWIVGIALAALILDRLLLRLESRGWIYYRRSRAGRGASMYHMLEIHRTVDPQIQHVIEVKIQEQKEEDESGEPPVQEAADESSGARE
ncbi:MAG: hypothetical protein JSU87_10645 [Gemmatimonadota bacterium]|nr:MAG: hypothetical protein JSU87_10645 [Gemmatimonadota bacterium]